MMNDDTTQLIDAIRRLLSQPPYSLHPSFDAIVKVDEYRRLVSLGHPILNALTERLEAGDLFLNRAILEIEGVRLEELTLGRFPSEQEIANAILKSVKTQVEWTAFSSAPRFSPTVEAGTTTNQTSLSVTFDHLKLGRCRIESESRA